MSVFWGLRSSYVQTKISNRLAEHIFSKTPSAVKIDNVKITPWGSISLSDILLLDCKNDTLLFVEKIKAGFSSIKFDKRELSFKNLTIVKPYMKLISYNDTTLNIFTLLDSFQNTTNADTIENRKTWDITIKNIKVNDGKFVYINTQQQEIPQAGMDYDHLVYSKVNAKIPRIAIENDTILLNIKDFSCEEKSGFVAKNINTTIAIANSYLAFLDTDIKTTHSDILAKHIKFWYIQGEHQWRNFTQKVKIDYHINNSTIDFGELTIFNENFKGYYGKAKFSGNLNGTIKNLRCKDINIDIFKHTTFSGNIYLNGLPYVENAYFDARIKNLKTRFSDIEKIYIPDLENNYFVLPYQFKKMGDLYYKGYFKGFFSEFVCKGNINSTEGNAKISLKTSPLLNENVTKISGNIEASNFNINSFLNDYDILINKSKIHLNGRINKSNISCKIHTEIDKLTYQDMFYHNIDLTTHIANKIIKTKIISKDKKLNFSFDGTFNLDRKFPELYFNSKLNYADLKSLGFIKKDNIISASKIAGNLKYSKDAILGKINSKNLKIKSPKGENLIKNIEFISHQIDERNSYTLKSSVADVLISGNIKLSEIPELFKNSIDHFLDAKPITSSDFNYNVKLKDASIFTQLIDENISISKNSRIHGIYNSSKISANINIPNYLYKKQKIANLRVSLHNDYQNSLAKANIKCDSLVLNNDIILNEFSVNSILKNKDINVLTTWRNNDKVETFKTNVNISKSENSRNYIYNIFLPKQTFGIKNTNINIDKSAIIIDRKNVSFNNILISNENSKLKINGEISTNPSDVLSVQFENTSLELLSTFFRLSDTKIQGIFNGDIRISDFYNSRFALINMNFNDILLNNESFGNATLNSTWNSRENKMDFTSSIQNILKVDGSYKPKSSDLKMNINIDNLKLNFFTPYFSTYFYNPSGYVDGNFKVSGTLKDPLVNGMFNFHNASIGINQTQTEYVITDELPINNNKLTFNNFMIKDKSTKTAFVQGEIILNNWLNPIIDIELFTEDFNILNAQNNNLVYGKANISGNVKIKGTPDELNMQADIATNKDSKIGIDLGKATDTKDDNFITFLNPNKPLIKKNLPTSNKFIPAKSFNSRLTIPSETDIELNFTSKIGNVLKTNGSGVLNFSNDENGNLLINGQYNIEQGNYQFSLFNLMYRKFDIQQGSFIQWNDNPHTATLDVKANYELRTSVANLLEDATGEFENKTTVLCILHLTDQIENPTLNFNIKFPNLDIQKSELLSAAFPTQEELNKQVISLLIFNRFYTPEFYNSDDNKNLSEEALKITANMFVNNYLNKVISKFNEDIDIGVNYRSADELHNEEIGIALSTQLFNNRVILNTNLNWETHNETKTNNQSEGFSGDVDIKFKMDRRGKLLFKAFTREDDNLYYYENKKNTQGLGIAFQDEFDTFKELIHKYVKFLGKKKHKN